MHVSVLLDRALGYLAIRADGIYVDATFGAGGHASAILSRLRSGRLIALDADPGAAEFATKLSDPRLSFINANFRELGAVLDRCRVAAIDGALFDLGVSSMQLDDARRGFTLRGAAPLDMRMNPQVGRSAYDILTTATEGELAELFFRYGEERASRRIARAIVTRRDAGQLPATTSDFAAFIAGIVRRPGRRERIHPATRVFQALRIAANDELEALREGLESAIVRLRAAGRIVAISFHSLEDRIVKQTFRNDGRLEVITRRPIRPDQAEISANHRSRSAKLRAAERKAS